MQKSIFTFFSYNSCHDDLKGVKTKSTESNVQIQNIKFNNCIDLRYKKDNLIRVLNRIIALIDLYISRTQVSFNVEETHSHC